MKTAILQVADSGPLESLVVMLRSVGYACYLPSDELKHILRKIGCDTVLDVDGLVKNWGYDWPMDLLEAPASMMHTADLYVDIKAHRNGPIVWECWPHLRDRTLFYRINGGEPEHVIKGGEDHGDEANLPCPILTPNLHYREQGPWSDKAYACWPPFLRFDEYFHVHGRLRDRWRAPVCLIHNISGWGYRGLIEEARKLGVMCYGGGSPDGLLPHAAIPSLLSQCLCMVHLKSSDAPGYALYEGLAAACPLIVSRRLIWRNRMQELFIPGETCLVFDRETHDGMTEKDIKESSEEIQTAIVRLSDPDENRRIGDNGRAKLLELMWDVKDDQPSLMEFMGRMFP